MSLLPRLIAALTLCCVLLPIQAQPAQEAEPINIILAFDTSGSMYRSTRGQGRWPDQALRLFYPPNETPNELLATDPDNRRFDAAEAVLRWLQVYQSQQKGLEINVAAITYRQSGPASSVNKTGSRILSWQALDSMRDQQFNDLNRPPSAEDYGDVGERADIRADYSQAIQEASSLASIRRNENSVVIFITDSIHCPHDNRNAGCTSASAINAAMDSLPLARSSLREYYLFIGPGGELQDRFERSFKGQMDRFAARAAASGGKFLSVAGVNNLMDGLMGVILREVARAKGLNFDRLGQDPARDDFSTLGVYRWENPQAVIPPYQVRMNAVVSTLNRSTAVTLRSGDRELSPQEPDGRDNLARLIQIDGPPPGPVGIQVEDSYLPMWVSYEAARAEAWLQPDPPLQYQRHRFIYAVLDGQQFITDPNYQPQLSVTIEGARPEDRLTLDEFSFERYGEERQPVFISEPFLLTEANLSYGITWTVNTPSDAEKWPREVSYSFLNVPESSLRPKSMSFLVNFEADTDLTDDAFARSYPLRTILSAQVGGQQVALPEGLRAELQFEPIPGAPDACPVLQPAERLLRRADDGLTLSREIRFNLAGQCQISVALTLEDELLTGPEGRLSLPLPRNVPRAFVITPTQRLDIAFVESSYTAQGFFIFTHLLSPNQTEVVLEIQDTEKNRERVRNVFSASQTTFALEILNERGDDLAKELGLSWSLKDDGTYRFVINDLPPGRYIVNATLSRTNNQLNRDRFEYDPSLPETVERQAVIEVSLNWTITAVLVAIALVVVIVALIMWRIFQRRRAALSGYLVIYKTEGSEDRLLWWHKLKTENTQHFKDVDFATSEDQYEMAILNIEKVSVTTNKEWRTARRRQAHVSLSRSGEGERQALIEEGKNGLIVHERGTSRYVLGKVRQKPDPQRRETFVLGAVANSGEKSQAER